MNLDRQMEINEARHDAADMRYLAKVEKAEALLGELVRDGKTVYYYYPVGGRYREGSYGEMTDFLIRNRYV